MNFFGIGAFWRQVPINDCSKLKVSRLNKARINHTSARARELCPMVLNDRDGGARCLEEDEDETILGLILDFIAREEEAAAVSSGQGHTGKPHCKRKAPEPSNPQLSGIKRWRLNHTKSDWWKVLQDVRTYDENCRNGLSFRRRFRVPRVVFDNLLEEVIEAKDENGVSVFGPKGPGPPPIPVNILLLGVLRFLALGCPWDVIEELSHVSVRAPPLSSCDKGL